MGQLQCLSRAIRERLDILLVVHQPVNLSRLGFPGMPEQKPPKIFQNDFLHIERQETNPKNSRFLQIFHEFALLNLTIGKHP